MAGASEAHRPLQAECAQQLASQPTRTRPHVELVVRDLRRIVLPDEIGGIDDVTFLDGLKGFAVFDVRNTHVAVLDADGRLVSRFGRDGSGPGEFSFGPMFDRRGGRLVALAGLFAVSDFRNTQLFTPSGRLVSQVRVDSFPEAYNIDFHSVRLTDGALVVGTSGKYRGRLRDSPARRRIELVRIDARRLESRTTLPLVIENSWALLEPFGRYPARRPYRDAHRRVWTASDSVIVVYPWTSFGICGYTTSGNAAYAFGVDAPRLTVDGEERDRVLRETFGDPDARIPFTGENPRELFAQHWPTHGPYYTDLVASDREVWALRRVDPRTLRVDVYDLHSGYRGTFDPPGGRLPRSIRGGLAVTGESDLDVALLTYRVSSAQ